MKVKELIKELQNFHDQDSPVVYSDREMGQMLVRKVSNGKSYDLGIDVAVLGD